MANSSSLATLSRTILKTFISNHRVSPSYNLIQRASFFSSGPISPEYTSDLDELPLIDPEIESPTESPIDNSPELGPGSSSSSSDFSAQRGTNAFQYTLEGGLDIGIYKAVIVGQVGQNPLQKRLKNGRTVTLTSVGTGGIRNERIPFATEEPREYADRCHVQWHRVAVYPETLGEIVMKHAQPGVTLYLEGNLETKIFTDPVTGLVRRVREIAIRRNGRVVFLGNGADFHQPSPNQLKGVGYF